VHGIADHFPIHQVFAVKHRNRRKIFECTIDKIIVISLAADTWVRKKPGITGLLKVIGSLGSVIAEKAFPRIPDCIP
jgi:hypothetical protein